MKHEEKEDMANQLSRKDRLASTAKCFQVDHAVSVSTPSLCHR